MNILNTIERARQDKKITLSITGVTIVALVVWMLLISQSADDLHAQLAEVSAGERPISNMLYDKQVVVTGELRRATEGLTVDLKAGGIDDVGSTFEPLFEQATSFLQSTESVEQWLTIQLQQMSVPPEEWIIEALDSGGHLVMVGDQCFTAGKVGLRWKLTSINVCDW